MLLLSVPLQLSIQEHHFLLAPHRVHTPLHLLPTSQGLAPAVVSLQFLYWTAWQARQKRTLLNPD